MVSNVVELKVRASQIVLRCSACGIKADAACDCNAPYVPAGKLAAKAIEANPDKSDRAIAAEIGVGKMTVSRARKSTAPFGTVERRKGRDGRTRVMPKRSPPTRKYDACDEINYPKVRNARGDAQAVFNFRYLVAEAINYCNRASIEIDGVTVTAKIIADAREVSAAWTVLANKLKRQQSRKTK